MVYYILYHKHTHINIDKYTQKTEMNRTICFLKQLFRVQTWMKPAFHHWFPQNGALTALKPPRWWCNHVLAYYTVSFPFHTTFYLLCLNSVIHTCISTTFCMYPRILYRILYTFGNPPFHLVITFLVWRIPVSAATRSVRCNLRVCFGSTDKQEAKRRQRIKPEKASALTHKKLRGKHKSSQGCEFVQVKSW